jgi:flagellar protein FliL
MAAANDAPAPPAPAGNQAASPPKKRSMMLIIVAIGVVLALGGFGAFMFLNHSSAKAEEKTAEPTADNKKAKSQIVTLKPLIVNLRNSKGTRHLKVTIGMETVSENVATELQKLSPRIQDFLVDRFSNVEINDVDNSVGRNRLKREILAGTNELLENGYVSSVYFTEFVIQ